MFGGQIVSLSGDKMLPIHLVVAALEKNIVELPLGQPEFADKRYRSIPLSSKNSIYIGLLNWFYK